MRGGGGLRDRGFRGLCTVGFQGMFLFRVGFSRVADFWVWGLRGGGFGVGTEKKGGGGGSGGGGEKVGMRNISRLI